MNSLLVGSPPNRIPDNDKWKQPEELLRAIKMRLHVDPYHSRAIDWVEHIDAKVSGDKVFVWIIKDGQATIIEDQVSLFPSDALTTQLRMLKN